VRHEQHRVPARAQGLDDAEQPVDLSAGEGSGRLVHDDHARVRGQRLDDLDELLIGDRQPAGEPVGVEPDAELVEDGGRLAPHLSTVDPAEPLERLRADEDVLGDGEVGKERRLLEDDRDPGRLRLLGVVEDGLLAVEHEPPRVRPVDAGEDLDERGLPGAVLADQPVHLARVELDVAVLERVHGAEALLCVLEDEQGLRMGCGHGRRLEDMEEGGPRASAEPPVGRL
jgi:hypothetical protein